MSIGVTGFVYSKDFVLNVHFTVEHVHSKLCLKKIQVKFLVPTFSWIYQQDCKQFVFVGLFPKLLDLMSKTFWSKSEFSLKHESFLKSYLLLGWIRALSHLSTKYLGTLLGNGNLHLARNEVAPSLTEKTVSGLGLLLKFHFAF